MNKSHGERGVRDPVSVCMATFNGAPFVEVQVRSILEQLGDADELIVSDDGSSDGTPDIVLGVGDPRVRLFHNRFRSPTLNFAFALARARHDILFLSDQDDVWLPGKVDRMAAILVSGHDMAVHDCEIVDRFGKVIAASYFSLRRPVRGLCANILRNSYFGACMALQRSLLAAATPFPADVPHDIWLGAVAEVFGRPIFVDEVLLRYRRHGTNVSATGERSQRSIWEKLAGRVTLVRRIAVRRWTLGGRRDG